MTTINLDNQPDGDQTNTEPLEDKGAITQINSDRDEAPDLRRDGEVTVAGSVSHNAPPMPKIKWISPQDYKGLTLNQDPKLTDTAENMASYPRIQNMANFIANPTVEGAEQMQIGANLLLDMEEFAGREEMINGVIIISEYVLARMALLEVLDQEGILSRQDLVEVFNTQALSYLDGEGTFLFTPGSVPQDHTFETLIQMFKDKYSGPINEYLNQDDQGATFYHNLKTAFLSMKR